MDFQNRSSPDVVREALAFSPPDPRRRLEAITAGWTELRYERSEFLLGAGIQVNPEPLRVNGRILPPPEIKFKNDKIKLRVSIFLRCAPKLNSCSEARTMGYHEEDPFQSRRSTILDRCRLCNVRHGSS